jgi:GBP family porin
MLEKCGTVRKIACLAFAAASSPAWSQTAPSGPTAELFGRLDASINLHQYQATAKSRAQNATYVSSDTSAWGIRGSENLGAGMRVYFKIESGFSIDTGAQFSATTLFNREAYVGLASATHGSIQIGSQFTPSFWLTTKVDPFKRSNTGAIFTLFQQGGAAGPRGYPVQFNNAVQYISPARAGLVARVMVATNENAAPFGNPASVSLDYSQDRLFVGLAYDRINTAGSTVGRPREGGVRDNSFSIGSTYRFDRFKVHGYHIRNTIDGSTGMSGTMLGVSVPAGSGEVSATLQRRHVSDAARSDARLVALQYMYFLSKRSSLYVGAAHQTNEGNANFGIWPSRVESAGTGLPAAGASLNAYQIGMRHTF